MSLTFVYVGAAAGLAPAASLRALSGGGAVFVPSGLEGELRELVADAAGPGAGRLFDLDPGDGPGLDDLLRRAAADPVVVALAGDGGPRLERALRRRLAARAADPQRDAPPSAARPERDSSVIADAPERGSAASAADPQRGPSGPAASPPEILTVPSGPEYTDALLAQELVSLKRIVDVLRVECPWDREQTPRDIVGYTVEEVYELADAIAAGDLEAEHGELGDLLLQVVLLALMLSEEGAGDLASVAGAIEVKLIRRHPHIFADAVAETPAEVRSRWERIKVEQEGRIGIFHDVPTGLPALLYVKKLQQRAAAVGFDWNSATEAFPKIAEEHAELAELFAEAAGTLSHGAASAADAAAGDARPPASGEAPNRSPSAGDDVLRPASAEAPALPAPVETPAPPASADPDRSDSRVVHEVGDLLFATVNVARLLRIDPELALREAGRRFERRVTTAAALAADEGKDWSALDLDAQEAYYQRAKALERRPKAGPA